MCSILCELFLSRTRVCLDSFGLTWSNYVADTRQQVKKIIIDYVRGMPIYFSRLFHVKVSTGV